MSTRSVDVMASRPGIYVVMTQTTMAIVEVDDRGQCFQLELASGTYARDGELRPGGWALGSIIAIEGPFWRTAPRESACPVCGGRPTACAVLGHRPESDRSVEWRGQD